MLALGLRDIVRETLRIKLRWRWETKSSRDRGKGGRGAGGCDRLLLEPNFDVVERLDLHPLLRGLTPI
jgi:hypothetical protein